MQSLGVIEGGFRFTEAEIQRASPRFWWGSGKCAAYERVLERRGLSRKRGEDDEGRDDSRSDDDHDSGRRQGSGTSTGATVAIACGLPDRQHEVGGMPKESWFGGGSDGAGGGSSNDGGTSSGSSVSDGGGSSGA
jgi:hypothetical protein